MPCIKALREVLEASGSTLKNANGLIVVIGPNPGIFTSFVQVYSHLARFAKVS
jgi:hypothetical protein